MDILKDLKYQVKWGNNHFQEFDNIDEAKLFAYEKAFYFDTYFDGVKVNRMF